MTSNSFIFTWQNLHYYSSQQCTVLSSAETAALPLALLKVLQADGASTVARSAVGTGAGASQSKQSAATAGAPSPRHAARPRILEQTGAALGSNFLQNSCVAPNRCRFASNSKKNKPKIYNYTTKETICKNLENNFSVLFLFLKL